MPRTGAGQGFARGLLAAVLASVLSVTGAQVNIRFGESGSDAPPKPQSDPDVVALPAYPKEEDLVGFFVSSANDFDFFVDGRSIKIEGGIIRYTLIARSPAGVGNVSYEAIRCNSGEYRIYAIGHADQTWSQRTTPWRVITPTGVQRWRHALLRDYFCPGGAPILTVAEGIDALERGRHPLLDPPHNRF